MHNERNYSKFILCWKFVMYILWAKSRLKYIHWFSTAALRRQNISNESLELCGDATFIWRNHRTWNNGIRLAPSIEYPSNPFPVSSIVYHLDHSNATKWPNAHADSFHGSSSTPLKIQSEWWRTVALDYCTNLRIYSLAPHRCKFAANVQAHHIPLEMITGKTEKRNI